MHKEYKNRLLCPLCRIPLILEIFLNDDTWLIDGLFSCLDNQNHHYPLINGTPRILSPETLVSVVETGVLKKYISSYSAILPKTFSDNFVNLISNNPQLSKSEQTANWYAFMWEKYNTAFDSYDRAELERLTAGLIDFNDYKGKSVVDVGGGQGRYIMPLIKAGVKEIFCVDLGEAISLASKKYRNDERVFCIQTDIYNLPLPATFDLVLCIGVLQHLPDPAKGFYQLSRLACQGGRIFAWCYGDSKIKSILIPLRAICRFMPVQMLWRVAALPAIVRFIISYLATVLRGLKITWIADLLPFSMYENYNFHYLHTNTFDHLSTKIINFFKRADLEGWMELAQIDNFKLIERFPGTSAASWVIDVTGHNIKEP